MIYIAIDPGLKGGITTMQTSADDEVRLLDIKMMPQTEMDIKNVFKKFCESSWIVPKGALTEEDTIEWNKKLSAIVRSDTPVVKLEPNIKCIIEAQHAFPGMGAGAQWTFAQHYGFLRGVLVSLQIPFLEVAPQTWMGYFGFKRQKDEDKKKHKLRILQKAQNLYPHSSVALQTADSLMLCEFLRLMEVGK